MNRKGLIFLVPGLVVGILLAAMILSAGASVRRAPAVGEMLEDLPLPGLLNSQMRLAQFRGKVVVLNFWATWCSPCREEMPLLQSRYAALSDQIVVIGINSQESEDLVSAYIQESQITFPIVLDISGEISQKFLIRGYPTTFFLDAEGVVRAEHIGVLNETLLAGYLKTAGVKP